MLKIHKIMETSGDKKPSGICIGCGDKNGASNITTSLSKQIGSIFLTIGA
jgi:hypothetical protein